VNDTGPSTPLENEIETLFLTPDLDTEPVSIAAPEASNTNHSTYAADMAKKSKATQKQAKGVKAPKPPQPAPPKTKQVPAKVSVTVNQSHVARITSSAVHVIDAMATGTPSKNIQLTVRLGDFPHCIQMVKDIAEGKVPTVIANKLVGRSAVVHNILMTIDFKASELGTVDVAPVVSGQASWGSNPATVIVVGLHDVVTKIPVTAIVPFDLKTDLMKVTWRGSGHAKCYATFSLTCDVSAR